MSTRTDLTAAATLPGADDPVWSLRLQQVALAEARRLQALLTGARRRARRGEPHDRLLARLDEALAAAEALAAQRRALRPDSIVYPQELPVSQARARILEALCAHQVVVVAGATGSGKTTQLPKLALEAGLGQRGLIGHTQPRRIAARTLAARIAEELGVDLGRQVGFQVRFSDRSGADTLVKVMTDGILLAELKHDPELWRYDCLILDEAHERSLNIDFLLGYLKRLLPRRPDPKLIITSATLDVARFAEFFNNAPAIEVEGRSYPVEQRYRPLLREGGETLELNEGIAAALAELKDDGPGDVLVFLPGEREIREAADHLRRHAALRYGEGRGDEILPLYARQSAAEQARVFAPGSNARRVVLATNVAETALTVPGIRYVIDSGVARVSRFSPRGQVQRLHIEPISQAAAQQRAGRCGRLGPGVCVRLYDEADFNSRPPYTDPEILRTNLAAVILRMLDLGLGDPDEFPFLDAPERRFVAEGFRLLHWLGAVDAQRQLSPLGERLARLPVDPRLARVLLAAAEGGCLEEALTLVSLLAIGDLRERPAERPGEADASHRRFAHGSSEFVGLLKLWAYLNEREQALSRNAFRRLCEQECFSWLRFREWQSLRAELAEQCAELELRRNTQPATEAELHLALLAGFLDRFGVREPAPEPAKGKPGGSPERKPARAWRGAFGRRFHLHPGSLLKGPGRWLFAAELMETTRLYARVAGNLNPEWLERLGAAFVQREYAEPYFEVDGGYVAAYERVSLFEVPIVPRRRINYGRIEPAHAREIFIREALVHGLWETTTPAVLDNQALIRRLNERAAKLREPRLEVDPELTFLAWERRLPADCHSVAAFEHWRRRAEAHDPGAARLQEHELITAPEAATDPAGFPERYEQGGLSLLLSYRFAPGEADDGASLAVPLPLLNQLDAERLAWGVPGLLRPLLEGLLRALPKSLRKLFVPVPEFARAVAEALRPQFGEGRLTEAVARELSRMTGHRLDPAELRPGALDPHLRLRVVLLDAEGREIDHDRDLAALRARRAGSARQQFAERPRAAWERAGLVDWPEDVAELPAELSFEHFGAQLLGYPGFKVAGPGQVALTVFETAAVRARGHAEALALLWRLRLGESRRWLRRAYGNEALSLKYVGVQAVGPGGLQGRHPGDVGELIDAALLAAVRQVLRPGEGVWSRAEFEQRLEARRAQVVPVASALLERLIPALEQHTRLRARLSGSLPLSWIEAANDVRDQLDHLLFQGLFDWMGETQLAQLSRWLKAVEVRLDRLDTNPERDRRLRAELLPVWEQCKRVWRPEAASPCSEARWLFEELRVASFAQELGTAAPASLARVERLLGRCTGH